MISFKKYTDVVGGIAKKLKVSKDVAVNALIKAQEKGMNPLKWQQNITMLQSYIQIAAEYESVNERQMNTSQKVTQMNYYWKDLDHMASDERKKKNMQTRFGIKNIKLDKKGNILSFESVEEEVDAHVKVMIKRGDSAEVIKKMQKAFPELLIPAVFVRPPRLGSEPYSLQSAINELQFMFENHHRELAAFICEPMMQGYGGFNVYPAEYLKEIRKEDI